MPLVSTCRQTPGGQKDTVGAGRRSRGRACSSGPALPCPTTNAAFSHLLLSDMAWQLEALSSAGYLTSTKKEDLTPFQTPAMLSEAGKRDDLHGRFLFQGKEGLTEEQAAVSDGGGGLLLLRRWSARRGSAVTACAGTQHH